MILNDIMIHKKRDLEELKTRFPLQRLREAVEQRPRHASRPFRKAVGNPHRLNLVCELKKASPSEGVLREDFQPLRLAAMFEHAGAAAISVLTESHYFKGRPSYLKTVRQVTHLPILRKDFIFDSYQLYETALLEADAFLLISSLLTESELHSLIRLGEALSMTALVEVHTEEDLKKALGSGAALLGINNRNLENLTVDPHRARQLIPHVPKGIQTILESGFSRHEELLEYRSLGVSAFLIGSAIMKSEDVIGKIHELLGEDKKWKK